ncbi:MAG: hypothetical protein M3Q86_05710 [Verrucomicrobiota bacterium]|nr:hypothetical protein [Verrucomicrobiota bacterium]
MERRAHSLTYYSSLPLLTTSDLEYQGEKDAPILPSARGGARSGRATPPSPSTTRQPESGTIWHSLATALVDRNGKFEKICRGNGGEPAEVASGVNYDIRKVDSYGIYPRFKFRVPLGDHGDCYDRLMMRVLELREKLGILQQAMDGLPEGPIQNPKVKIRASKPPLGEAYGRIEAPKGELGFYLIRTAPGIRIVTGSVRRA